MAKALDDRPPFVVRIVPAGFDNGRVESDMLVESVFVGDSNQMVLDLFLAGVFARPAGVGLEGVGVEVAQD